MLGIVIFFVILVIAAVALTIYFVTRHDPHRQTNFDIRVAQIPTNTTLVSIDDVQNICSQQGDRLATTDNINTIMKEISYTYCTRGYVDNATVIPVSANTRFPGCPTQSGLNLEPSLFPCIQGSANQTTPSCAQVAFCYHQLNK